MIGIKIKQEKLAVCDSPLSTNVKIETSDGQVLGGVQKVTWTASVDDFVTKVDLEILGKVEEVVGELNTLTYHVYGFNTDSFCFLSDKQIAEMLQNGKIVIKRHMIREAAPDKVEITAQTYVNSSYSESNSERDLLIQMITHPAGYGVQLFGTLKIRPCFEDFGSSKIVYAVDYDPVGQKPTEWLFSTPEEAVDFYLAKRQELELGIDFEQ